MDHAAYLDMSVLRCADWERMDGSGICANDVYDAALALGNLKLCQREDRLDVWGPMLAEWNRHARLLQNLDG